MKCIGINCTSTDGKNHSKECIAEHERTTMSFTFEQYAQALREARTRQYPLMGSNMVYPALKCAGEAGELADKIGKHWRNESNDVKESMNPPDLKAVFLYCMSAESMSPEFQTEVKKEMGDVLWYLFAMCEEMGCSLEDIAKMNIEKVTDRAKRNVICSSGDNR